MRKDSFLASLLSDRLVLLGVVDNWLAIDIHDNAFSADHEMEFKPFIVCCRGFVEILDVDEATGFSWILDKRSIDLGFVPLFEAARTAVLRMEKDAGIGLVVSLLPL